MSFRPGCINESFAGAMARQKTNFTPRCQDAKFDENAKGKIEVDAAVRVHRELGPGLLETVYEESMACLRRTIASGVLA
jgi:hypothetical protein